MTTSTQTKIVLYFLAIVVGSWSADAAELQLRSHSHAKGSLVLLGDVADVHAADAEWVARLQQVELFPSPPRNRSRLMHVRELAELLALHGVDTSDLDFTGSRTTRIYPTPQPSSVAATRPQTSTADQPEMMVVTRRAINRGDVIRDADIELQPVDPKVRRSQLATQRRAVVGMEALAPIARGQSISLNQLRKPLLVRRGEVIRVRARAAGVQVTTTARATEDGSLGDIILVQSLENREKYPTHVTGLQQVEVYVAGVVVSDSARDAARRPGQLTETR